MAEGEKESLGIRIAAWAIMAALLPAIAAFIDGMATFGKQLIGWLKTGTWKPHTLLEGLQHWGILDRRPSTGWYVPDAIINYFLDGSRWVGMIVVAFIYMGALIGLVIWLGHLSERLGNFLRRAMESGG